MEPLSEHQLPVVLICALRETRSVYELRLSMAQLFNRRATLFHISTDDQLEQLISRASIIILIDLSLGQYRHAASLQLVTDFMRRGGTCVLRPYSPSRSSQYNVNTHNLTNQDSWLSPIFNWLGLTWKVGTEQFARLMLNPEALAETLADQQERLPHEHPGWLHWSWFIEDVAYKNALYVEPARDAVETPATVRTPVAISQFGAGWFAFLGDTYRPMEIDGSKKILLALCRLPV
ncbi:Fc.00g005460.m01.CDS01 [Cosmosporella sp. VM-42]